MERIFVLLAGPLPGIFLAYLLFRYLDGSFVSVGIVPQVEFRSLIIRLAVFGYILNLFNLLPLFPLDGGRVVNLAFFSMHPWIDLFLKIGAFIAFSLGAIETQDPILSMLSVGIIALMPQNYRQAKALYSIRKHLPEGIDSPLQNLIEIFSALNKAGYASLPYQQRSAYVNLLVENWSAMRTTPSERVQVLAIYIGFLVISLYMVFTDL